MNILCECNSFNCKETIDIPFEELEKIKASGNIIIAKGCSYGADPTDILINKEIGYSIYKEQT